MFSILFVIGDGSEFEENMAVSSANKNIWHSAIYVRSVYIKERWAQSYSFWYTSRKVITRRLFVTYFKITKSVHKQGLYYFG